MGKSSSRGGADPAFRVEPAAWTEAASDLLAVRHAVFVREQGVPIEVEQDGRDAQALHFIARDGAGMPIGAARLLADAHIGRLAVLPAWRGCGVGRALLDLALTGAAQQGMRLVVLHAQLQARRFYEAAGFRAEGEEFLEAGIRHVRMVRAC